MSDQKRLLQFTVLESFSGSSPHELSLLKHDIVYVIENNPSGWSWVHEPDLGNGWFPTSYLEPRMNNENDLRKSSDTLRYVDVINELDHEDEECPYVYATRDAIQKVKKEGNFLEYEAKAYRATHSYERKNQDELSFSENDIVLVVQETDTGWWRGSTSDCEGWFPASYVEELDSSPVDSDDNYACVNDTTSNQSSLDDSLYQVTKLVDEKSLNSGENNRKDIHQVPQTNYNNRRRNRSTGSVRRPSRDPPPIPLCFDSIDEVKTLDETEHPEVSKEQELPFPKATATVTSTSPKASHDVEPLSTWTCDEKSDNLADDETASNEDETNNVQGVVIFRRRNLSTSNNLSTLIKVTKRRSIINPNPVETPPNRPVPIPPPRNLQNSKENVSSRSRPTIKPRKRLQYAPQENPDRSPPMLPKDNLNIPPTSLNESKDTLSTSLKSDNSDTPAPPLPPKAKDVIETLSNGFQSPLDNHSVVQCPNRDLSTCSYNRPQPKTRNGKNQEVQRQKVIPTPSPRRRSSEPAHSNISESSSTIEINNINSINSEESVFSSNIRANNRTNATKTSSRSSSVDEDTISLRRRPKIQPRSKSTANLQKVLD